MGHLSGLDGCLAGRCSPPMVAHATRVMFQVNFQPKTSRRERQHTRHPQGVQPTAQTPSCVRLPTAVCRRIDLRGGSVDVPNAQSLFYCTRVSLLPKTSVSRSKRCIWMLQSILRTAKDTCTHAGHGMGDLSLRADLRGVLGFCPNF